MLAEAAVLLAALNPIVVHDSRESFPLSAVGGGPPAAYGHAVALPDGGAWLQYWLFYDYQDQDRGIVRSGRHEGDWELVQFRVTAGGRPVEAVYAQHSGAERCGMGSVTLRGGRPVVFSAHGSHASYLRAGTRDRMWPDPNDEADGRGVVAAPRLVVVSPGLPAWMRRSTPWGGSRGRWYVPPEQDSPLGPFFQPGRWDAAAFAASAGSCRAACDQVGECDGPEKALTAVPFLALLGVFGLRRYRTRTRTRGE
jgi:Vacuolar protein sorting-associated protein 62